VGVDDDDDDDVLVDDVLVEGATILLDAETEAKRNDACNNNRAK